MSNILDALKSQQLLFGCLLWYQTVPKNDVKCEKRNACSVCRKRDSKSLQSLKVRCILITWNKASNRIFFFIIERNCLLSQKLSKVYIKKKIQGYSTTLTTCVCKDCSRPWKGIRYWRGVSSHTKGEQWWKTRRTEFKCRFNHLGQWSRRRRGKSRNVETDWSRIRSPFFLGVFGSVYVVHAYNLRTSGSSRFIGYFSVLNCF